MQKSDKNISRFRKAVNPYYIHKQEFTALLDFNCIFVRFLNINTNSIYLIRGRAALKFCNNHNNNTIIYSTVPIYIVLSESKATEIYCMADDLCREFSLQQEKYMIESKIQKHRNKLNRMNNAEIMVILILVYSGGFRSFKHYYKNMSANICNTFSHNRFL